MTADDTEPEIETSETSTTIRRTFDASRERVFRAFTDPEDVEQWFGPGALRGQVHALEPEPGGAYSVSMIGDDVRFDIDGKFVEVVENERIVHTWEPGLVTIELRDVDDGCEVVLTHDGLPDTEVAEGHASGWASALDNLAEVL